MNFIGAALPTLALMLSVLTGSTQSIVSTGGSLQSKNLRSTVRQGSNTTYFDLMRMVLPDLQFDPDEPNMGIAHHTISFRQITEKGAAGRLEGNLKITSFEEQWITSRGRQILILMLDLAGEGINEATPYEGEATLLAVFSLEPTLRLIDRLDIKTDRFTSFWEKPPVFQLDSQNSAFVVYSSHFNAGENYNDVSLWFLDGQRLKMITSIFLLNTQGCGATFSETPDFRALPGASSKYPKIMVRVKLRKEADTRECDDRTPGYTRYYQSVFSWSRAKAEYQGNSRQLEALDKFNRER